MSQQASDDAVRRANLAYPPNGQNEIRVHRGDCVVSIWLPAEAGTVAEAMQALAAAGFDWHLGDTERVPA